MSEFKEDRRSGGQQEPGMLASMRAEEAGAPSQQARGKYHFLLDTGEAMDETRLGAFLKRRAGREEEKNNNL